LHHVKTRFNDFPCWKGLLKVKDIYLYTQSKALEVNKCEAGSRLKINNGNPMRHWKDVWLGDTSLQHQFPLFFFYVCQEPEVTFQECVAKKFVIFFRRRLQTEILEQ
jgi:hypothetical protein